MKQYTVDVPKTRDPFVNVKLVPIGIDPQTGEERFWTSTWNNQNGSIGAVVTTGGKQRIYHFNPGNGEFGFYGAAFDGCDTLWMTCFTDRLYEFHLSTGEIIKYPTGVASGMTNSGLTYDPATKKVFYTAYCQDDFKRKGLIFDTVSKKVFQIFEDIPLKNNQLRCSVKNPDGSYTLIHLIPDLQLMKWNPLNDTIEVLTDLLEIGGGDTFHQYISVINREDGAIFLPRHGWYDPLKKSFTDGPVPPQHLGWFGRDEHYAYGARRHKLGNSVVYRWNFSTGQAEPLAEVPDVAGYTFALSRAGKILCVNLYGYLYIINKETGVIETTVRLDSDARGHIDCLWRIDEERLLGTPFITQRFFEINLAQNTSQDLGRATGGSGQVAQVCEMNGTVYMASYTKGQMVAYDPLKPAHFPENPHIVCEPPEPAMRPVAMCRDENHIYYSNSYEYGTLGSMMVKYTKNNPAVITDNPIPNHMIRSLTDEKELDLLIAGTTYIADCNSVPPIDRHCKLALLDKHTLLPTRVMDCEPGFDQISVIGQLGEYQYLVAATNIYLEFQHGSKFYLLNTDAFTLTPFTLPKQLDPSKMIRVYDYGKPGWFVFCSSDRIQLWDLNTQSCLRDISPAIEFYNGQCRNDVLYLISQEKIHIFEGLKP